jgi:hypothetical protein
MIHATIQVPQSSGEVHYRFRGALLTREELISAIEEISTSMVWRGTVKNGVVCVEAAPASDSARRASQASGEWLLNGLPPGLVRMKFRDDEVIVDGDHLARWFDQYLFFAGSYHVVRSLGEIDREVVGTIVVGPTRGTIRRVDSGPPTAISSLIRLPEHRRRSGPNERAHRHGSTSAPGTPASQVYMRYFYAGDQMAFETDSGGTGIAGNRYIWGLDVDDLGIAKVAARTDGGIAIHRALPRTHASEVTLLTTARVAVALGFADQSDLRLKESRVRRVGEEVELIHVLQRRDGPEVRTDPFRNYAPEPL